MLIRPLLPAEVSAALRLSTQAGWNHVEADLRRLLSLWPGGYFAGAVDETIVATTTLATFGSQVGWVGLVLVDEAHRRQGYGGQMLDFLLAAAQEASVKTLGLDATELGRPLYLARGFADVAALDRWRRTPMESPTSLATEIQPRDESHRALDDAEWKELLAFDHRATRVDRGRLLNHFRDEPVIFWRTLRTASPALSAYAMLRPGRLAWHIAPVIAESEAAAQDVLDKIMADIPANLPLIVDVPAGRLKPCLTSHGFAIARSVTRMQAGIRGPDLLGPKVYAGCGFELG